MSVRYQNLFKNLASKKEGAFIPFAVLCDPNMELSLKIIDSMIEAGADALELGLPFSDPMADGPTIQAANLRALTAESSMTKCFEALTKIRAKHPTIPIGLLVYANLVFKGGIYSFYQRCADAGVDSVLIADVPIRESQEFREEAMKHNVAPIYICPPSPDMNTLQNIVKLGKGYTYLLSRAGVTGADNKAIESLADTVEKLKQAGAPPAIQGFGISEPEQVRNALKDGAAGAIAGSATVNIIEEYLSEPEVMLIKLIEFVQEMKQATRDIA